MRVQFSPLAQADLAEIKRYISRDKPVAAARFIRSLRDRIRSSLATYPELGQACDEIATGLRRFPIGTYVVFYRVTQRVEIARVLHGAREIEAFFQS